MGTPGFLIRTMASTGALGLDSGWVFLYSKYPENTPPASLVTENSISGLSDCNTWIRENFAGAFVAGAFLNNLSASLLESDCDWSTLPCWICSIADFKCVGPKESGSVQLNPRKLLSLV